MSDIIEGQREVVAGLQERLKLLTRSGAPSGHLRDLALALAASIDKLRDIEADAGCEPPHNDESIRLA